MDVSGEFCPACDRWFKNDRGVFNHWVKADDEDHEGEPPEKVTKSFKRTQAKNRLNDIDGYDPEANGYVYVLTLQNGSDVLWYVGQTSQMVERLCGYLQNYSTISVHIPNHSEEVIEEHDVDLVEVHEILSVQNGSADNLRYFERQKFKEMVYEKGPDKVIGGK